MSKRGDKAFVNDKREAIHRIESYTLDISYSGFLEDYKTQDAVIRNLEIISEAAKKLSSDFKAENSHIPWKDLAGVRYKLIHHYFGVNFDIVRTIIKDELSELNLIGLIDN